MCIQVIARDDQFRSPCLLIVGKGSLPELTCSSSQDEHPRQGWLVISLVAIPEIEERVQYPNLKSTIHSFNLVGGVLLYHLPGFSFSLTNSWTNWDTAQFVELVLHSNCYPEPGD